MRLKYVSITGADDAVDIAALNDIASEYPFVEWAILLMPEGAGQSRFPTAQWIEDFKADYKGAHKAMHLCGSALHGFIEDKTEIREAMEGFQRIQLNLEFGDSPCNPDALFGRIEACPGSEFIIQYTDRSKYLLPRLLKIKNHAILFDASAGQGLSPDSWPAPLRGHFCGYAGGMNPDNVLHNIEMIAKTAGDYETWIDMESGVRTAGDRFDLEKVRRVLSAAAPFHR